MTVGSLFAGIGGFDLGFRNAGFDISWQVEIDTFCQSVLQKHFPEAIRHGDIREVGKHNLEPVDVICGGFPCQDISYAGNGTGIEGERSGLWSEYRRIVGELRPRYVVIENVAAIVNRGLSRVLCDLAELGYDAEWENIPASALGAIHRRERIWIVAYANGEYLPGLQSANGETEETRRHSQKRGENGIGSYVGASAIAGIYRHREDEFSPRLAGVDDGFPAWVLPRAAKAIGNAVYTLIPEMIAKAILKHEQAKPVRRAA